MELNLQLRIGRLCRIIHDWKTNYAVICCEVIQGVCLGLSPVVLVLDVVELLLDALTRVVDAHLEAGTRAALENERGEPG